MALDCKLSNFQNTFFRHPPILAALTFNCDGQVSIMAEILDFDELFSCSQNKFFFSRKLAGIENLEARFWIEI